MTVPFTKLRSAATELRQEMEVRSMVKEFAREVAPGFPLGSIMKSYDKYYEGDDSVKPGAALASALPIAIPAELYFVNKYESLPNLLRLAHKGTAAFTAICTCIAEAARQGSSAVIVFRVRHFGLYVAHNMDGFGKEPHIVMPAKKDGMASIKMMPLENFSKIIKDMGGLHVR